MHGKIERKSPQRMIGMDETTEMKNRGEYLPNGRELDDEFYYHGTYESRKDAILEEGIKIPDGTGYYGKGLYASRSKWYAKEYGDAIIILRPKDSADIKHIKSDYEIPKDTESYDIIEVYEGVEVVIKNPNAVEVIE